MTITKLDLTRHLSDTVGLSTKECDALVNTLFDTIRSTLASGEDVKLSGFGNFTLRDKRARPGRNPKSGEPVEITARARGRSPHFMNEASKIFGKGWRQLASMGKRVGIRRVGAVPVTSYARQ